MLVIAVSYTLFFYLVNNTETSIRKSLFEQQKQRQIESTGALSSHIGSDLNSIMSKLEMIANLNALQQVNMLGNNNNNKTLGVLERTYHQINSTTLDGFLFQIETT